MSYKKDKNGNEMYKKDIFVLNKENDQIYAKDANGNEIYPKFGLAKNRMNEYYYAKDADGNEYYPQIKKFDFMIPQRNGDVLIARLRSFKQLYPKDKYGNEHYPIDRDHNPIQLLNEQGKIYLTKDERYVYRKTDVLGNKIYTTDPRLGRKLKTLDLTLLSVVCLGNLPLIVSLILTMMV